MATDKRTRQKQARRDKLEAQRKVEQRRKAVRRSTWIVGIAVFVVVSMIWIVANNSTPIAPLTAQQKANNLAVKAGCPAATSTRVNTLQWSSAPAMSIDTSMNYLATFHTTAGDFEVLLNTKEAPQTVNNFVFLADHKYYNCIIFHRVIPGFMIQGGDPTGTGTGGPGYTIADEYPTSSSAYKIGTMAMANTGSAHTGGSQFFIVTGAEGTSLPPTYTAFGQVVSGMSVVKTIEQNGDANANSDGTGTNLKVTERMLTVTITPAKA